MGRPFLWWLHCACVLLWGIPTSVRGQVLPARVVLEIPQGPVVAQANILGMGGASTGLAQGAAAILLNPAAVANRSNRNRHDWFDWDWALDWLNIGLAGGGSVDVENNGSGSRSGVDATLVSGALQFVGLEGGFGLQASTQAYRFCLGETSCSGDANLQLQVDRLWIGLGYNFLQGQLVVGTGLAVAGMTLSSGLLDDEIRASRAIPSVGVLWRPHGARYRIGVAFQGAITAEVDTATEPGRGLTLPDAVRLPAEVRLGAAIELTDFPLNSAPSFGLRARYDELEGRGEATPETEHDYAALGGPLGPNLLVAADVVVQGPSDDALGIEAWGDQRAQVAGRDLSVGVRWGAESEVFTDRLRIRAGGYYEASRFRESRGRLHATAGFDFRLFKFVWQWRLGAAGDVARRYNNIVLSFGFWSGAGANAGFRD